MKKPRLSRPALFRSCLFSLLLASPALAITTADIAALRAKAEKGNAIAQYNLGLAYADRTGPAYDPVQAYVWLNLAAGNGATGKALETLSASLTPAQLAQANTFLASGRLPAAPAASPVSAAVSPIAPVSDPAADAAKIEADKKQLSEELASSWKETDRIKASFTSQLADANKRLAIAESALANKDKELAALQARLDASAAPSASAAELESLRRERDQLRAAFAKVDSDRVALQVNLAEANKDIVAAQNAQRLAEAETGSLRSTADKVSAERLSLAAQLENANTEASRLRTELEAAKASSTESAAVAELREKFTTTTKALADAQAELAALKSAGGGLSPTGVAVLKADRDHLSDTVAQLTKERDDLAQQLAAAKAPAPAADTEAPKAQLATLEKSKADAEAKLNAALRTYTLNQAEIDRLQKALANIDAERAGLSDKLDAANKELNTLLPQAQAATVSAGQVETLRAQLADTQSKLAERSAALDQAVKDLATARLTTDAATGDITAVREQLRQTQLQAAASANETLQLKTRLALSSSAPVAPTRPGAIAPIPVAMEEPPSVAPSPVVSTPKAEPVAAKHRIYVVMSGDSLSSIAKRLYGNANRWNEILEANSDIIRNPNALPLGTKLRIP
ncbi:MAG: LysM peptidoglycan-binding domain-containing protein [Opitutaceae bacterium]|jgi:chromosome segregation ATPase